MIYLFTGQPGSGKTTLAKKLQIWLQTDKKNWRKSVFHIDGDQLREIFPNQDYSKEGREKNIQKAFDIAKFFYLEKSVIINNISGKNVYVIISSNPIKTVSSFAVNAGASGVEAGVNINFEDKGDYEEQKITILNHLNLVCTLMD